MSTNVKVCWEKITDLLYFWQTRPNWKDFLFFQWICESFNNEG